MYRNTVSRRRTHRSVLAVSKSRDETLHDIVQTDSQHMSHADNLSYIRVYHNIPPAACGAIIILFDVASVAVNAKHDDLI